MHAAAKGVEVTRLHAVAGGLADRLREGATWVVDTFADLSTAARAAVIVVSAVTMLGLGAAVWLAVAYEPATPTGATLERLEAISYGLSSDPEATIAALPPWAVGRFDGLDGDRFEGTVAIDDPTGCLGLRVTVGASWLSDGDPSAIEVEGPVILPAERCAPR